MVKRIHVSSKYSKYQIKSRWEYGILSHNRWRYIRYLLYHPKRRTMNMLGRVRAAPDLRGKGR